jgi:hypothetical protein
MPFFTCIIVRISLGKNLRSIFAQEFHHLKRIATRGAMQRRPAIRIRRVDVDARVNQKSFDFFYE